MRGISTWLFSKIVMLIFVTMVYGSMLSIMNVINERSYADSAEVIAINIRDAVQGVTTTGALSAQRVVPLPQKLPEDTPTVRGREYTIVLNYDNTKSSLSTAMAWNSFYDFKDIKGFVASSLIYTPAIILDKPLNNLVINSSYYRFFVVNKTMTASGPVVYIGACRSAGITSPTGCTG